VSFDVVVYRLILFKFRFSLTQFGCHIATCSHLFPTPKARRLHLIDAHGYPKEYFFAVTNKGVGGLLKRWGEGASMLRKEWKAREKAPAAEEKEEEKGENEDEDEDEDEEEDEEEGEEHEGDDLPVGTDVFTASSNHRGSSSQAEAGDELNVSTLTDSMQSLSLVPPSIRFGRGGKTSGFAKQNARGNSKGGRVGRAHGRGRAHGLVEVGLHGGVGTLRGDGNGNRGGAAVRGAAGNNMTLGSSSHGYHQRSDYVHRGVPPPVRGRGMVNPRYGRGRGRGRGRILIPFAH
jgi:hypothetical protein